MAAMSASIRMSSTVSPRIAALKASLLSEITGLAIGFITLAWIVSCLNAL